MRFSYICDFEKIAALHLDTFLPICKDISSCQLEVSVWGCRLGSCWGAGAASFPEWFIRWR